MVRRVASSALGDPRATAHAFHLELLAWAQDHQRGLPTPARRQDNAHLIRLWNLARDLGQDFPAPGPRPDGRLRAATLPDSLLNATVTVQQKRVRRGKTTTTPIAMNGLDWLVQAALAEPKEPHWNRLIHWAVRSGFDPNRFNGRRTPVGEAALAGRVDLLQTFQALGADLLMPLKAEHLASDAPGASARVGSTLLHRVVRRLLERDGAARSSLVEVAAFLARQVPGSLTPDAGGWDPMAAAPEVLERYRPTIETPLPEGISATRRRPRSRR